MLFRSLPFLTSLNIRKFTVHVLLKPGLKNFPQFVVIKGFIVVSEADVDLFLEFLCLFYDPFDVGNLISGSFAFSKTSLNIWKIMVHVLLKPGLENFEHYFTSM